MKIEKIFRRTAPGSYQTEILANRYPGVGKSFLLGNFMSRSVPK